MEFRLTYEGPISANADSFQKWIIRRQLEPQLGRLWNEIPFSDIQKFRDKNYKPDDCYVGVARHGRTYVPIVSSKLSLYAELDVLFLSSSKTGDLLHTGGDLDNRLKTLFDALTIPTVHQVPPKKLGVTEGEFNCLMEDDKLIRRVSVESDRLLKLDRRSKEVFALIHVIVKLSRGTWANIGLIS